MKKYLIKGLLTLFVGGFVASCADDDVNYIPIEQQKATAYAEAFKDLIGGEVASDHDWGFTQSPLYDEDEIAAIRAMTRGHNAQANMWASQGKVVPVQLTREQKNRVIAYFQNNQLTDGGQKNLTEFFVQQVYKGGEDGGSRVNILNTTPAKTSEQYRSAEMTTPAYGSNTIDKLFANTNDHINNYNHGTCSSNDRVSETEGVTYYNSYIIDGVSYHTDEIMLMTGSYAKDFGYNCSNISLEYNDHYVLVDGSVIDKWANEHANGFGASVSGRAFVGFDFDLLTPDRWYTNDNFSITDISTAITLCTDANGNITTLEDADLDGDYKYNGQVVKYLDSRANNMISGDRKTEIGNKINQKDSQDPWGKTFDRTVIDNLIKDGYHPVKDQPNTWILPEITRDYYYSDWIVCIVPSDGIDPGGVTGGSQSSSSTSNRTDTLERHKLIAQGRIFCEDLGTNADRMTKSDIDFNDAVFDARIWRLGQYKLNYVDGQCVTTNRSYIPGTYTNGIDANGEDAGTYKYVAEILLLAAGGTVPLNIGGICPGHFEIHDKFGTGNNRNIAHTTIINTVGEPSRQYFTTTVATDVCNAVKAEIDITSLVKAKIKADIAAGVAPENIGIGLDIIPIEVQWTREDNSEAVGEISANYGQAPQKLRVDLGTRWVYERVPIIIKEGDQTSGPYRDFDSYARNKTPEFWKTENIDWDLLYPNNPESMTASETYDVVKKPGKTTTTTTEELIVWEGEAQTYGAGVDDKGENNQLTLYSTTFSAHNKLRVYGSNGNGNDRWITFHNTSWQPIVSSGLDFSSKGYVDIDIPDDTKATELSNGPMLYIAAKNCTITKIAKVVQKTTVQ